MVISLRVVGFFRVEDDYPVEKTFYPAFNLRLVASNFSAVQVEVRVRYKKNRFFFV